MFGAHTELVRCSVGQEEIVPVRWLARAGHRPSPAAASLPHAVPVPSREGGSIGGGRPRSSIPGPDPPGKRFLDGPIRGEFYTLPRNFMHHLSLILPVGQDEALLGTAPWEPHPCTSKAIIPWSNSKIWPRPSPRSGSGDASRPSSSPCRDAPLRTSPGAWPARCGP